MVYMNDCCVMALYELLVRIKLKRYLEDGSQATEGMQHAQVST